MSSPPPPLPLPPPRRCGLVALLGASNAGKSCLLNALIGESVAETHRKRHRTRTCMEAVWTSGAEQMILQDTPGLSQSKDKSRSDLVTRAMHRRSIAAARAADIELWIFDAARGRRSIEEAAVEERKGELEGRKGEFEGGELFATLNKIDRLSDKSSLLPLAALLQEKAPFKSIFMLSAKTGQGVAEARAVLLQHLPQRPFLYNEQGDRRGREIVASDVTRTILYDRLHGELPYDALLETESFRISSDGELDIAQRLCLRRESQSRILLARDKSLLRLVEARAERALSRRFSRCVRLSLHLRSAQDWHQFYRPEPPSSPSAE